MSEQGMYDLSVKGLHKAYGDHRVLEEVSFDLPAATTLAVIGASGCGKTTLLKCLAGLIDADAGHIRLGHRSLHGLPARTRSAVYLYQEPLLFPHLDVFENVAFGLRLRRTSNARVRELVIKLLHELDLTGLERQRPEALSGGQRQRVAFGRALIVQPSLLLLDEPFSNLDPERRTMMQDLFKRVAREHRITAIFVTHDVKESLRMGDHYAILSRGKLRAFRDRATFCADPGSGVSREREFWRTLSSDDAPVAQKGCDDSCGTRK